MPGLDTLQDTFEDGVLDTASRWSGSYGDPDEVGGRARIPCTTGYAGLKSASVYTLTGNGVFLRLYAATPGGATTAAASVLVLSATGGTDGGFIVDPAQSALGLYLREGYADPAAVFLTYSAVDHAWLRFRESAGSLHWDTSPDGVTWTTHRTAATPAWAAETGLAFLVEGHRDAGASDFIQVDNVNTAPYATITGSATLTAASDLAAAATRTARASSTLAAATTLSAAGSRTARGTAALTGSATLTAAGSVFTPVDVTLTVGTPRGRWEVGAPWR